MIKNWSSTCNTVLRHILYLTKCVLLIIKHYIIMLYSICTKCYWKWCINKNLFYRLGALSYCIENWTIKIAESQPTPNLYTVQASTPTLIIQNMHNCLSAHTWRLKFLLFINGDEKMMVVLRHPLCESTYNMKWTYLINYS